MRRKRDRRSASAAADVQRRTSADGWPRTSTPWNGTSSSAATRSQVFRARLGRSRGYCARSDHYTPSLHPARITVITAPRSALAASQFGRVHTEHQMSRLAC